MISTRRLLLIPLTRQNLSNSLVSIKELSVELDLPIVSDLLDSKGESAVEKKLEKMRDVPEFLHPWHTYWLVVIQAENIGVGLVGFKGAPDRIGSVEISYSLSPIFQGRGYMTEAVVALTDWAFSHRDCLRVTATQVAPENYPSRKVLFKAGFQETLSEPAGVNYRKERD